jgi:hypothetical protein
MSSSTRSARRRNNGAYELKKSLTLMTVVVAVGRLADTAVTSHLRYERTQGV